MILDTSFLIDLQRELAGAKRSGAKMFLGLHAAEQPWISLPTWMEFAEGYADEREEACRLFLGQFRVIAPDEAIAWRASRLARLLRGAGTTIGDHDMWIAATALERNLPLVTRNPRHFSRVPGLQLLAY
jgi:tRNA(fMet)-specific endonuclease VapC